MLNKVIISIICCFVLSLSGQSYASQRIEPLATFLKTNGLPAASYKLFTYNPGTSVKKTVYKNSTLTTAFDNPIILNTSGRPPGNYPIYFSGSVKYVLAPSTDSDPPKSALYTIDNYNGSGSSVITNEYTLSGDFAGSLAAAATALNALNADCTLVIDIDYTMVASVAFDPEVTIRHTGGNEITLGNYNLTGLNVPEGVGLFKWLNITGTGRPSFGAKTVSVYPEWFGVDGTADEVQVGYAAAAHPRVVLSGDYNFAANAALISGNEIIAKNNPTITCAAATYAFSGAGTQNTHLDGLTIDGVKFIGSDATVSNWAIQLDWFDNVKIVNCKTTNIHLVYLSNGATAYASTDIAKIQKNVTVDNNECTYTIVEDDTASIQLRYMKHFSVCHNKILGYDNTHGSGIYVYGGGTDPAGDGAPGLVRKCFDGEISHNIIKNQVSGINISQASGMTVVVNELDDPGEALWVGAGKDIICSKNIITNCASNGFQTQGICENVVFKHNIAHFTTKASVFMIGSVWGTEYNIGPIIFEGNTVYSDVANLCTVDDVGMLIIRNNTMTNCQWSTYGSKITNLEVTGNTFLYDLFGTNATFGSDSAALFRIIGENTILTGMGTISPYTKITDNTWFDRTLAQAGAGDLKACISLADPGQTSSVIIENNSFKTHGSLFSVQLMTSSDVIGLKTAFKNNKISGRIDSTGGNTSALSEVVYIDNYDINGGFYYGAPITDGIYSIGSREWSNDPLADGCAGWVCNVSGTVDPAVDRLWVPFGNTGFKTLADDATPTVLGASTLLTGGTTTITDFDDGVTGQIITIVSEHAITITDGTNIFLNGSANFVMAATDTLTLICKADNKWYELSRSVN